MKQTQGEIPNPFFSECSSPSSISKKFHKSRIFKSRVGVYIYESPFASEMYPCFMECGCFSTINCGHSVLLVKDSCSMHSMTVWYLLILPKHAMTNWAISWKKMVNISWCTDSFLCLRYIFSRTNISITQFRGVSWGITISLMWLSIVISSSQCHL